MSKENIENIRRKQINWPLQRVPEVVHTQRNTNKPRENAAAKELTPWNTMSFPAAQMFFFITKKEILELCVVRLKFLLK